MINLVFEKADNLWNTIRVSRPRQGHFLPYPFAYVHWDGKRVQLSRYKTIGNTTWGNSSKDECFKNWDELLKKHPCLEGIRECG